MHRPTDITLIEVGPRDGFQSETKPISTELKLNMIRKLQEAGLSNIQVTSFVHPKWVPQMADADELCRQLTPHHGDTLSALTLNLKGVERAKVAGIAQVDMSMSASDTHSLKNANKGLVDAQNQLLASIDIAQSAGIQTRVGLQCAFGCKLEGAIDEGFVLRWIESMLLADPALISLADSTGMANPFQLKRILPKVLRLLGNTPLVLHLHDTEGLGMANLVAALECGVHIFDTAFGGLGGCPYIPGASGNIVTEDVVVFLEREGIRTGIDPAAVAECSLHMAAFLERNLPGKQYRLLPQPQAQTIQADPGYARVSA